jgi:hypothetical protein
MVNTLEISGSLKKKINSTDLLTIDINPKVTYTEYMENEVIIGTASSASINLGVRDNPTFIYAETDNPVLFKCFRGSEVVASTLPIESSMLLTLGTTRRIGTVTVQNEGSSNADVKIYIAG